jgi:hypothetical protein
VVSERVQVGPDRIHVRLVVTDSVQPARVEEAKRLILRRTGKDVDLAVRRVAGEEELALLRQRLITAAPPAVLDLENVHSELMARLDQPLKEIWPSGRAQLLEYELGFSPKEIVVRIRYQAEEPLEAAAEEVISRALRARLGVEQLRLIAERQSPPAPPRKPLKKGRRR